MSFSKKLLLVPIVAALAAVITMPGSAQASSAMTGLTTQDIAFMGGIDPADRKPQHRNYYRRLKGRKR